MDWLFTRRVQWAALLVSLALVPVILHGAKHAWDSNQTRAEDWLPASFPETQTLIRFVKRFGTDELLMVSWEGCTLDDPRLPALKRRIELDDREAARFREVLTGPEILEGLRNEPLSLTRDAALARMRGWILGRDGRTTGLIVTVTPAGAADREAAVEQLFRGLDAVDGLSRDAVYVAGPTIETVAIDQTSKRQLLSLNGASFLVCIIVMYFCLRSWWAALMLFAIALFNEQASMAMVYYTGRDMDSVLLLMANVTYVISIAAGVHLVNYYREARRVESSDSAARTALRCAWRPTLLAAGTTAIGFGSLASSQIVPIQRFGVYAAVAVSSSLLTIVLMAMWLQAWGTLAYRRPPRGRRERSRYARLLTGVVAQGGWPIRVTAMVLLGLGAAGVTRLQSSVQLHDLFQPEARLLRDYAWLEERIGGLVPVEVVIRIDSETSPAIVDQLRTVGRVAAAIRHTEAIDNVVSALNFAPAIPPTAGTGWRAVSREAVLERRLESNRPEFARLRFLDETPEANYWRLSGRVAATDRVAYGKLLRELQQHLADVRDPQGEPLAFYVSGGVPLVYRAQEQLLEDLVVSFLLAFGLIMVVLSLLLRSFVAGVLVMLPNVLPSAMVFGMIGWLGWKIEIGSVMTASAALGIAVDDTLHYVSWYRRHIASGGSPVAAIARAYDHCAAAMTHTTLICALGLLVFALSPFTPIARFAWLMFTLLTAALACDLLVLPAILTGPFARAFAHAVDKPRRTSVVAPAGLPEDSSPSLPDVARNV